MTPDPARLQPAAARLPDPGLRIRGFLLAVSGGAAFILGFRAFDPARLAQVIRLSGYYYLLAVTAAALFFAGRVAAGRRAAVWGRVGRGWLRARGLPVLALAASAAFALGWSPFGPKVLFDDYVVQGTAWEMHASKEVRTPARGYDLAGTWSEIGGYLDKRPYFIPFVVSLVHDATGYRPANALAVNAAFALATLGLAWWAARQVAGPASASLCVLLLASLPIFGLNATGTGLEMGNLAMLSAMAVAAILYLRVPGEDRLSLLVLSAVLLAQCRYESILFAPCAAVIALLGWGRAGRVILPWAAVAAPLLLVPCVWHNRVIGATPAFWQLHPGASARFSAGYLRENLAGARAFYLGFGRALPSSWFLAAVGAAGGVWAAVCLVRRHLRIGPEALALAVIGAGIGANAVLLLFYFWARLDDPMASRFALPTCLLLAWAAAFGAGRLEAGGRLARAGFLALWVGAAVWVVGWGLPEMRQAAEPNPVAREIEWERAFLAARPGPVLFVTETSTIPFFLWRIPAVKNDLARGEADRIRYQLKAGMLREVVVAQRLDPLPDSADAPPPGFRLETLAERSFGSGSIRLSRAVPAD